MLDDISQLFVEPELAKGWSLPPTDFESARSCESGHGRVEERTITVSSMLEDYTPWPYLAQVFKLERRWWDAKGEQYFECVGFEITLSRRLSQHVPFCDAVHRHACYTIFVPSKGIVYVIIRCSRYAEASVRTLLRIAEKLASLQRPVTAFRWCGSILLIRGSISYDSDQSVPQRTERRRV